MSDAKRNWNVMLEENHIFQGYKQNRKEKFNRNYISASEV